MPCWEGFNSEPAFILYIWILHSTFSLVLYARTILSLLLFCIDEHCTVSLLSSYMLGIILDLLFFLYTVYMDTA